MTEAKESDIDLNIIYSNDRTVITFILTSNKSISDDRIAEALTGLTGVLRGALNEESH